MKPLKSANLTYRTIRQMKYWAYAFKVSSVRVTGNRKYLRWVSYLRITCPTFKQNVREGASSSNNHGGIPVSPPGMGLIFTWFIITGTTVFTCSHTCANNSATGLFVYHPSSSLIVSHQTVRVLYQYPYYVTSYLSYYCHPWEGLSPTLSIESGWYCCWTLSQRL